ncbi:MAG TPA: class I SAM-dependent methyltransferase [Chitinophagaceae bacterium]|nr:class I SAM-dependent methyltransferase [Chitinophagaceae bacterium]
MKDNFSRQSKLYAKYRPAYPQEVFDFILNHVTGRDVAWDCGTGNGQTAKELAKYFEKVFATDISEKQIQKGYQAENIFYSVQSAEQTNFKDESFDLITVSQALHWFAFNEFYAEVKRVTKPGGWIAVWTYTLPAISQEIDQLVHVKFYKETLGSYWDYERKFVDEKYATLPFPFKTIPCPVFEIKFEWTLDELEGYLSTWSALQKFIATNQLNPVDKLIEAIKPMWRREKLKLTFPVYMRMGQIEK